MHAHWRLAALAASLLCVSGLARALTVNAGEVAILPASQPFASLVLNGGTVYLSLDIEQNPQPSLSLAAPVFLQGGYIRSGTMSGNAAVVVRFDLSVQADTVLSGSTVLDGGFPGDGEALGTRNHALWRQTGAGELTFWTLSNFSNLGTYQIENDLGIQYADVWAALEHRDPYVQRFVNSGLVSKVAGAGTSVIGMPLDNQLGKVLASSGTLRLDAAGQHSDGTFQGLGGGRLELAGDQAFRGQTVFEGNVNVLGGGPTGTLVLATADALRVRSAGAGFAGTSSTRDMVVNGLLSIESSAWFTNFASLRMGAPGRAEVAGTLNNVGQLFNAGNLTVQSPGRLAFSGDVVNEVGATLLNRGSMEADFDGARWGGLINQGLLSNAAGARLSVFDVTSAVGSSLNNDGFVTHSGRWDLAGGLAIGAGGTLEMQAGSSLTTAAGAQLTVAAGGLLNNLGGTLTHGGGRFSVDAGGQLVNGAASTGTAILQVTGGALALDGTLDNSARGIVIVEAGGQVSGSGHVSNAGVFAIRGQGAVAVSSFMQNGGLLTIDGTLDTQGGDIVLNGGTLNGGGYIQGNIVTAANVNPGDAPKIYPGHSPGHLTVSGSLRLLAGAELQLQVEREADGSLAWDEVTAGDMFFASGSRVQVVIGPGVAAADWQQVSFLECGNGCSFGDGVQFTIDGAPGSSLQWSPLGLTLSIAPLQAVPEPSTLGLMLGGLLLAAARLRGRGDLPVRRSVRAGLSGHDPARHTG